MLADIFFLLFHSGINIIKQLSEQLFCFFEIKLNYSSRIYVNGRVSIIICSICTAYSHESWLFVKQKTNHASRLDQTQWILWRTNDNSVQEMSYEMWLFIETKMKATLFPGLRNIFQKPLLKLQIYLEI